MSSKTVKKGLALVLLVVAIAPSLPWQKLQLPNIIPAPQPAVPTVPTVLTAEGKRFYAGVFTALADCLEKLPDRAETYADLAHLMAEVGESANATEPTPADMQAIITAEFAFLDEKRGAIEKSDREKAIATCRAIATSLMPK